MKTKARRYSVIKRLIYVLFFLIALALQSTFLGGLPIALTLLVPVTAAVCSFEKELGGMLFGLLGGALYDIVSPAADGIFALLFTLLGCAAALMMRYVLRGTLLSVFIITLVFSLLAAFTGFTFTVLAKSTEGAFALFRLRVLPGALLTALTLPVFYYPVRAVNNRLQERL